MGAATLKYLEVKEMSAIRRIIDKTIDIAVVVSLGTVAVLTFAQVISRFVFKLPIPWSTDIIRLAFIYTIFLGATIGIREKGHLNIDVVFNLLPKKVQALLSVLINVMIAGFLVFLVVKGMNFVLESGTQQMPYLQIPISLLYFAIPFNAMIMLYYLTQQTVEEIFKFKNPQSDGEGR